jgi:hypothetical protein
LCLDLLQRDASPTTPYCLSPKSQFATRAGSLHKERTSTSSNLVLAHSTQPCCKGCKIWCHSSSGFRHHRRVPPATHQHRSFLSLALGQCCGCLLCHCRVCVFLEVKQHLAPHWLMYSGMVQTGLLRSLQSQHNGMGQSSTEGSEDISGTGVAYSLVLVERQVAMLGILHWSPSCSQHKNTAQNGTQHATNMSLIASIWDPYLD